METKHTTIHAAAQITADPYPSIPESLKELRIWLPFRTTPRQDGRLNKIPCTQEGRHGKYTNQKIWLTYGCAIAAMRKHGLAGIGIVVTAELGLVLIDLDHCFTDDAFDPTAERFTAVLDTYTEVSYSGDGLHAIAGGHLLWAANKRGMFEMYDQNRFFVMTGKRLAGTPGTIEPRQAEIEAIHVEVFGPEPKPEAPSKGCDTILSPYTQEGGEGLPTFDYPDQLVVAAVLRDAVARKYFTKGVQPHNKSASEADFALAWKLAFYCRKNISQMHRLFMESALASRAKCRTRRGSIDYVTYTLQKACRMQPSSWEPRTTRKPAPSTGRSVGRPASETTRRVLAVKADHPELNASQIGEQLSVNPATVRKVLSRHQTAEPAALQQPDPSRPALMSCPQSVRRLYPKPSNWKHLPAPKAPQRTSAAIEAVDNEDLAPWLDECWVPPPVVHGHKIRAPA